VVPAVLQLASLFLLFFGLSLIFHSDIRSSLKEQFHSFGDLPKSIFNYLEDMSSNLTRGALGVLPILLSQTSPSIDLFIVLKQPFDNEIISRTPSSFHNAMHSIHNYLMVSTCIQYTKITAHCLLSAT